MGRSSHSIAKSTEGRDPAHSEPSAHDEFQLGAKRHGVFAVGVQVSEKGILPSGEGEEGHGGGDADIESTMPTSIREEYSPAHLPLLVKWMSRYCRAKGSPIG
jgi:hypothetical protein